MFFVSWPSLDVFFIVGLQYSHDGGWESKAKSTLGRKTVPSKLYQNVCKQCYLQGLGHGLFLFANTYSYTLETSFQLAVLVLVL